MSTDYGFTVFLFLCSLIRTLNALLDSPILVAGQFLQLNLYTILVCSHLFVESLLNFIIDFKVLLTTGIVEILYFLKIFDNLVKFVMLYGKHTFG